MYKIDFFLNFSVAKKTGILQHLMGHRLPTGKTTYDIISVSSSGRVTSHSSEGVYQWQVSKSEMIKIGNF